MRCFLKRNGYEAQVDTFGAELVSLKKNNHEIMWCADPEYWGNASLVLFPFIGRNYDDTFTIQGKRYRMGIHGFASASEFTILEQEADSLLLCLKENEETLQNYPFRFELRIRYALKDDGLSVSFEVINDYDEPLPFNLGFHPGFRLEKPLEQYRVFFPEMVNPCEIGIVSRCMLNGKNKKCDLPDRCIPLNKDLFTESAKIYSGTGSIATLQDDEKDLFTIVYEGFENIVLWQTLNSDADFICIEGWNGLPGRFEHIEDVYDAPSRKILEPKQRKQYRVQIRFS
ncbi:MAG: hypothetical protein J5365_03590 [Erysipelotrichaceae bacterium]|nr:hypothetical protein [Erysipelotrichaceae bacterium]